MTDLDHAADDEHLAPHGYVLRDPPGWAEAFIRAVEPGLFDQTDAAGIRQEHARLSEIVCSEFPIARSARTCWPSWRECSRGRWPLWTKARCTRGERELPGLLMTTEDAICIVAAAALGIPMPACAYDLAVVLVQERVAEIASRFEGEPEPPPGTVLQFPKEVQS
jgi:hypothetical protein